MARPSNTEQRRGEIVDALARVMAHTGYSGASVTAIAREAGLAPGLVHYHFATKLEILVALVETLAARLSERETSRAAKARSAWQRLEAFIDARVALGTDADPVAVACWVVIGAEALREPEVRETYRRAVASELVRLTELVQGVLAAEGRRRARAGAIAAALLSSIEGAYQLAVVARVTPRGFAAPMLKQSALGLIGHEPMLRGRDRGRRA